MPDNSLTACGADCLICPIYIAARDPEKAVKLAEAFHKEGQPDAKPEWFTCQGCYGSLALHWSDDCTIRPCCQEKGLDNCSQCPEFQCEVLVKFENDYPHHKAFMDRLRKIRDNK
ncbi:MAG: DUF3795 domain-containing protein [Candidatus Cloacimonetes bacterium]|nr:DUF3795 domain-containing protein [Candidatus Cloacimonadota bacterium]